LLRLAIMEEVKSSREQGNAELKRQRSAVVISGDDPHAKYEAEPQTIHVLTCVQLLRGRIYQAKGNHAVAAV
jgi:hypothetical protein